MGGGGFTTERDSLLDDLLLSLSAVARPCVCFVPTPAGGAETPIDTRLL